MDVSGYIWDIVEIEKTLATDVDGDCRSLTLCPIAYQELRQAIAHLQQARIQLEKVDLWETQVRS